MKLRHCSACGYLLEPDRPERTCPICRAAKEIIVLSREFTRPAVPKGKS